MSGDKDVLIMPRNSEKLYDICPCKKKHIKIFDGDHNSKRPELVMKDVMKLIKDHIDEKKNVRTKKHVKAHSGHHDHTGDNRLVISVASIK